MKKTKLLIIGFMLFLIGVAKAQMVLEYNIATANTEISLPLAGTVNVIVDWGDGTIKQKFSTPGSKKHTYYTKGTKTVTITGVLTGYGSGLKVDIHSNRNLSKVISWNGLGIKSFSNAFKNAMSLKSVPGNLPSTVTNLSHMFDSASSFNQSIAGWNTASVTDMSYMFAHAYSFNQPIGSWNTASVTNMSYMFASAISFNQPIGNWNIAAATNLSYMFNGASLCTENYDHLLNGWSIQAVKTGISFDGGNSKYSTDGTTARNMLSSKGWTITDAGLGINSAGKCQLQKLILEYDIVTANTQIAIPLAGSVNVSVNWGDGSATEAFTTPGNKAHTFTTTGTKTVIVSGTLTAYGNSSINLGNARLTKVLSWYGLGLTDLSYAFYDAKLLTQVPVSIPSTVTNLSYMFYGATSFNQPINTWNTAKVTNMGSMFYNATSFNQPISAWNTGAVTLMKGMFRYAGSFNQPIGSWNTTLVQDMSYMFQGAKAFNQSIGNWKVANVISMEAMFSGNYICTSNYDNLLNGWSSQTVKTAVFFDAGKSNYSSAGAMARNTLASKGWIITDLGLGTTAATKCSAQLRSEDKMASDASLSNEYFNSTIALYPNPAFEQLSVKFPTTMDGQISYSISSTTGSLITENTSQVNGAFMTINIENLLKGSYILKIKTSENNIVKSFVKE